MPPFLRNVITDLVEKRLWPVAVALVAALVAVPIALGGKSEATTPPAVASAATSSATPSPTTAAQVVSLEQQAAGKTANASSVRDPFVQHHQPHATDAEIRASVKTTAEALVAALAPKKRAATSASTSTGGGSSSSTGGSTSTGTTTPSTGTTTPSTGGTTTPAKKVTTYSVDLSFGESGAERKYNNIARLTPLPSSDSPFFVYMGLSADKRSATFLINGDVVPSGDGHCTPSPTDCQQITLTRGDIEFFDMQSGTAGVVQYQLELLNIKATTTTAAKAQTAKARESKAGRDVIRQIVATDPDKLSSLTYNKSLGLLQRTAVKPAGEAVSKTNTVVSGSGS
ncbi:hypothetical protein [Conexibacter woesei]|uniref:hypothetical protein n=1 Tax=Conexibacter woesei TaxID=191495 RepID=UPI000424E95E|nr:hypothetical protein [Conexibacter woesei]